MDVSREIVGAAPRQGLVPLATNDHAEIFREMYLRLRRFAAACSGPAIDPDDLVQEALARTLSTHALDELREPEAYLRTVIVNLVRTRARRDRHRHDSPLPEQSSSDSYPSDIHSLLAGLSTDERAVMFLVDVESFTYAEAGRQLGITPRRVKHLLTRGRSRLRAAQGEEPSR